MKTESYELLKFNSWSEKRLREGKKFLTSRRIKYVDTEQVRYIIGPVPWEFIRDFLYTFEGAESPEELQRVINGIFRRKVADYEEFYVHVLDVRACILRMDEQ